MSFPNAAFMMEIFDKLKYTGLTFVAAYKQVGDDSISSFYAPYLKYNFFFTTAVEYPSRQELEECITEVFETSTTSQDQFQLYLAEYFRFNYKCEIYSFDGLEICLEDPGEQPEKCLCSFYDLFITANETVLKKNTYIFIN
jgi:hypothetical protein